MSDLKSYQEKLDKLKNEINLLNYKIKEIKEDELKYNINSFFIIFNCYDGKFKILEKEEAIQHIDNNIYSYNNCSYVAIVEKDSSEYCQYINVYNLFPEYDFSENQEKLISLTGDFEPICKIWNTEFDSRGVNFIEKGTIQEEFIFYIGILCDEIKSRYIKFLNSKGGY